MRDTDPLQQPMVFAQQRPEPAAVAGGKQGAGGGDQRPDRVEVGLVLRFGLLQPLTNRTDGQVCRTADAAVTHHEIQRLADGDGFDACADCDDTDPFRFPDAAEACNDLDDDCDGNIDEDWDADGDGSAGCRSPEDGGDCDDTDPLRAPSLVEQCDSIDNDCDGVVDEGFDADGDGWETCRGDCDDTDPNITPVSPEICGDGVDNDCNPSTSEDGDLDGDGLTACDGDCNDGSAAAYPGAAELCDDLDNDCDGNVDNTLDCYSTGWWDSTHLAVNAYLTWSEAAAVCASADMSLVVVSSSAENEILLDIGWYWLGTASWIGLNDIAVEGTWVYEDGSAPAFTRWYPGEPNNSGNEDCTGVNFGDWGYWNDYSCEGTALPFVCELGD